MCPDDATRRPSWLKRREGTLVLIGRGEVLVFWIYRRRPHVLLRARLKQTRARRDNVGDYYPKSLGFFSSHALELTAIFRSPHGIGRYREGWSNGFRNHRVALPLSTLD